MKPSSGFNTWARIMFRLYSHHLKEEWGKRTCRKCVVRGWQGVVVGQVLSENDLAYGRFGWESIWELLESNAIRVKKGCCQGDEGQQRNGSSKGQVSLCQRAPAVLYYSLWLAMHLIELELAVHSFMLFIKWWVLWGQVKCLNHILFPVLGGVPGNILGIQCCQEKYLRKKIY